MKQSITCAEALSCTLSSVALDASSFMKPWAATSWKDGVFVVKGPMCMATDERGLQGTGYVRKETGWMTNDENLTQTLEGVSSDETGKGPWHRHTHLVGGIARQAAV